METVPKALSGRLSGESECADTAGCWGRLGSEGTNMTQTWSPPWGFQLYSEEARKRLGRFWERSDMISLTSFFFFSPCGITDRKFILVSSVIDWFCKSLILAAVLRKGWEGGTRGVICKLGKDNRHPGGDEGQLDIWVRSSGELSVDISSSPFSTFMVIMCLNVSPLPPWIIK